MQVIREIREYLKERVFRTIIPRDTRLAEIPRRQAPVIAYDKNSPGSKAYVQLTREILSKMKAP
jgi:chromosome partitioning protein